jgi:hypothetical protein
MEKLILSLGPAFAAGLAIQQLLELSDGFIEYVLKIFGVPLGIDNKNKKILLGLIALVTALFLTVGAGLRVLEPLGVSQVGLLDDFADILVTALIISAGTESFNSIIKFLGYVKDNRRATAKDKEISLDAKSSTQ